MTTPTHPNPPNKHWYVAIVNRNNEIATASRLSDKGFETFVAAQEEIRIWKNGKRKKVNRIIIPNHLFIRCTEKERLAIIKDPAIFRFLTNRAGTGTENRKPIAIIPDDQMETLRFMLGQSDSPVNFTEHVYTKGEEVRVIRGTLQGLEGKVFTDQEGTKILLVVLGVLGGATVSVSSTDIEIIPQRR